MSLFIRQPRADVFEEDFLLQKETPAVNDVYEVFGN